MTVEATGANKFDVKSLLDDQAEGELPRSVHTSVDAKILYLEESDEFQVAVTETNAFPEAQEYCDEIHDEDWVGNTVEALTSNLPEDGKDVVVNFPPHAFDGDHDWLKSEKEEIASRLKNRLDNIRTTVAGEDLQVTEETVEIEDQEFDYVLNLSDIGDHLNSSISGVEANSRILNAPTAVWNTRYDETGKAGLQDISEEVIQHLGIEGVHVPENRSITYFGEAIGAAQRFFRDGESAVLKGDFGTHGDEVVYLDREKYLQLNTHLGVGIEDYVRSKIREVEERVSEKSTADPDYCLFNESKMFNGRGETSTAVVERAVEDGFEIDGETTEVVDYDGRPIDLTLTAWDVSDEYRTGVTVRASERSDTINANCGSQNFDLVPYGEAFHEGIYQGQEGPPLRELLEETAGRQVSEDELLEYAGPVAATALGTRTLSARRAEETMMGKSENPHLH